MSVLRTVIHSVLKSVIHDPITEGGPDFFGTLGNFSSAFSTDFSVFRSFGLQFSSAFSSDFANFRLTQDFNSAFSTDFAKFE